MKIHYNNITLKLMRLLMAVMCALSLSACADELLLEADMGEVDGSMRELDMTISFDAESEQPLATRATDTSVKGNAIQNINDLRLVIYDAVSGALLDDLTIVSNGNEVGGTIGAGSIKISGVSYDKNHDNRFPGIEDDLQDSASGRVTFKISIPSARYYMYAIANAPDITREQLSQGRNAMKSIPRRWVIGDISKNSEMFGIFSHAPDRNATDNNPLSVTNKMTYLHCWLRRLASKVTVAFDGTELYDNVLVFIDSIAIRDIPQQCLLGMPNTAGRNYNATSPNDYMLPHDDGTRYKEGTNGLYARGPFDLLQQLENVGDQQLLPGSFLHVCNHAHPYLGRGDEDEGKGGNDQTIITSSHSREAMSLFFYENLQGTGNCKKQDADGDKIIDNPSPKPGDLTSGWKDGKPYGTYIEVHGYYRCNSFDGSMDAGPIRYRFMLGKDTDRDFNAERNTHYQLTLKLKGYGNDADWHIEYENPRKIVVASPQFISYLFNKKMMATVKIVGEIPDNYYLRADIEDVGGSWKPWSDGSTLFPGVNGADYTSVPTKDDGPWNSFLSLRETKAIKVEDPDNPGQPSSITDKYHAREISKRYYAQNQKGVATYKVIPNESGYDDGDEKGKYFVSAVRNSSGKVMERVFSIPLYTRAKELVTWSGFTGNNPYFLYPRMQRVKLSIVRDFDSKKPLSSVELKPGDDGYIEPVYLTIIQVPRIENPKGVWRNNTNDPFTVELMQASHLNPTQFQSFLSMGKWSAEVLSSGAPIVTLTSDKIGSGSHSVEQVQVSRIEGDSGYPIHFTINFTGAEGCAIVKVRYHNYTCEHDIFCRKGYEPIQLVDGGVYWETKNVDYFDGEKAVLTKNPLQEGSMFRRGSTTAILASNSEKYGFAKELDGPLDVKYSDKKTGKEPWENLKGNIASDAKTHAWSISNKGARIAKGSDFYTLIAAKSNDINFPISKAYGVLYGDGAKSTQSSTADAYGYDDLDGGNSPKGMRGVFVYNLKTYNQIFLPIGASGHGRRKTRVPQPPEVADPNPNKDPDGMMRYSNRSYAVGDDATDDGALDMNQYRPLFYDLYKRPGAIYWLREYRSSGYWSANSSAFDLNYFTMGFEGFGNNAVPLSDKSNTNACFIRTVVYDKAAYEAAKKQ